MPDSGMDFDFIVIGSGYGGSVSALRLVEKGYTVAVIEMGRRWLPEDMPRSSWSVGRWIWRPSLALRGHFNIQPFRHAVIMHGCAVGGGSITYANALLEPRQSVWEQGSWAGLASWKTEMSRHYQTAKRMLGVVENRIFGPADQILKDAAEAVGVGGTFYRQQVGIFEPPDGEAGGKTYPDPYFGGEGPERATCIGCGECIIGCRHNAKNSLDKNYLYLAEKHGARVFAETRVVNVKPLDGQIDGKAGYEVRTVKSTAWLRKKPQRFTCRAVIFAASALGTMDLLSRLKEKGSLPSLSDQVGARVRTNAEALIAIRAPGYREAMSRGVTIGSGIYLDEDLHIEVFRYPKGSDSIGLLTTLATAAPAGRSRLLLWLGNLLRSSLRHPVQTFRCLQPFGWARESLILLCMQTLDEHINMRLARHWWWPFRKTLSSYGPPLPSSIPKANEFAIKLAAQIGGVPLSMLSQVLFNVPSTAHILGGCPIGDRPSHGVVDHRHRVFGYWNLYICDGSVVAANLGVNPALTITALAERAMSFIPAAAEATWNDCAQELA